MEPNVRRRLQAVGEDGCTTRGSSQSDGPFGWNESVKSPITLGKINLED